MSLETRDTPIRFLGHRRGVRIAARPGSAQFCRTAASCLGFRRFPALTLGLRARVTCPRPARKLVQTGWREGERHTAGTVDIPPPEWWSGSVSEPFASPNSSGTPRRHGHPLVITGPQARPSERPLKLVGGPSRRSTRTSRTVDCDVPRDPIVLHGERDAAGDSPSRPSGRSAPRPTLPGPRLRNVPERV